MEEILLYIKNDSESLSGYYSKYMLMIEVMIKY